MKGYVVRKGLRAIFEFIEVFYNRHRLHSSLGYLSPAAYESTKVHHHKAAQAACSTCPSDGVNPIMYRMLPHYLHRRSVEEVRSMVAGTVWSASAMKRGFEVLAEWSSVDRLENIACPTLVVAGRHDVFTSFPQAHRIGRRVRDATVEVLEHSGHFPWLDDPTPSSQ